MPPRNVDFKGFGELQAERAAAEKRRTDARHAPGPDLSEEACVDCGAFGPWGDGRWFYCREHVPKKLLNAGRAFARKSET